MRSSSYRLSALALVLGATACGSGEDGIRVEFYSATSGVDEQMLTQSLVALVLVIDSQEGLYPPGSARTEGDVQLKNTDLDPNPELVATLPVSPGHLPKVRIEQAELPDVALTLTADGVPTTESEGLYDIHGSIEGVRFSSGKIVSVRIPLTRDAR